MQRIFRRSRTLSACLAALLLSLCAFAAMGQSGRRARKPTPQPTSTAEPSPTPDAGEATKPALIFIVGMARLNDFLKIPAGTASAVLRTCANRLDDRGPVKADTTSKDMNLRDAVQRAKSEKEAYVAWLKLRPNDISGAAGSNDPENLYIEYAVFAPATGKQVASGRVFSSYRARTVTPGPKVSTIFIEGYLIQMAKETADRILADFKIR
jgi:hypothetical protein